jgi:hypothetical protein
MKTLRLICAVMLAAAMTAPTARAQEPPKPGPEHAHLKKFEGNWDTTFTMGGQSSKGKATYKMDLGGLWLLSTFDGEMGGMKFQGRGADSYDPAKKKYVSVWIDSMSTSPMTMAGDYDKAKKTLTLAGEGPGEDGKPTKYKSTSEMPDDNTINFKMYVGGGAEPAFTIVYKRQK